MQEIISKGVMRSGNVLLRLILNHIFNERNITSSYAYRFFYEMNSSIPIEGPNGERIEGVVPSPNMHNYEVVPKNKIIITPWRDPRDSMISFIRTEYSKQNNDKFPTIEFILENCERTAKEQMDIFKQILIQHYEHPQDNILELKYENYHNNFDFLFNKLEEFFKKK